MWDNCCGTASVITCATRFPIRHAQASVAHMLPVPHARAARACRMRATFAATTWRKVKRSWACGSLRLPSKSLSTVVCSRVFVGSHAGGCGFELRTCAPAQLIRRAAAFAKPENHLCSASRMTFPMSQTHQDLFCVTSAWSKASSTCSGTEKNAGLVASKAACFEMGSFDP